MGDDLGRRLGAYAVSTKNVAGLALAIAGLLLHFTGVVGAIWPLVVAALYAVGALVAPADRRVSRVSPRTLDPDGVRRALEVVEAKVRRSVPPEFAASVRSISARIRDLLGRVDDQPVASEEVYVLGRIATEYLPATIDGLLRLPADYRMTHRGADGRTPYEMACTQVALLDRKLTDVSDAMLKGDSDELAAHGRFLEERFGGSSLGLPAPGPRER